MGVSIPGILIRICYICEPTPMYHVRTPVCWLDIPCTSAYRVPGESRGSIREQCTSGCEIQFILNIRRPVIYNQKLKDLITSFFFNQRSSVNVPLCKQNTAFFTLSQAWLIELHITVCVKSF